VIALMPQSHYDTTGWVEAILFSGVVEHGFAELRAGRKMKLLVDPTI
jgi:(R,R)-butanediol dehydrogenase/meso-butanediol dehydrogenase/diacetyl reductase